MMDFFPDQFLNLSIISSEEAIVRMLLSVFLASMLGLERDFKDKPIDFRAFSIISLASCVLAILSQELYANYASVENVISMDLGKIISGVVSGIGFLGAGAIIKNDKGLVVGTATGASIWAAGTLGLTVGFGFYGLAIITFIILGFILLGGGFIATFISKKKNKNK